MKRVYVYSLALAGLALLPFAAGQEQKPPKEESLMKKKLAAAQKLLGGLAQNDFETIRENADRLNDYSKLAAWKLIETPRYEQYSDEFQRLTLKMSNQAKAKNIDGVALSYVDMTLVCVKCHQHVREQKVGMNPPTSLRDSGLGR
jgi:hypothetical protein